MNEVAGRAVKDSFEEFRLMTHTVQRPHQGLTSFLTLNFLCGCATGILQLAIPLYALFLSASTFQLGLIAGVSGVGRMLIIVPSGLLVDRFGARRLFLHSTVWCAILVLTMISVTSPWALTVVMFFQGMAQSVSFLALQAGFLKRLPYLEPEQAGWQRGATQLGFFLVGPVAGGLLLREQRFGAAFLVVSAIFAASIGISFYRRIVGIREIPDAVASNESGELRKLQALLSDPLLRKVLGVECLGAAVFMIFRAFVAPVAVDVLHLTVGAVSAIVIFQGTAAMASLFAGGRLLRRFSAARIFVWGSLLVIVGMLMLAIARDFFLYATGSIVYGVGTGLMSVCSLSQIGSVLGEKGKIAALFSLSIAVGSTFGPILAGFVGEASTAQAAFLTPVAIFAIIFTVFAGRDFRERRSGRAEAVGDWEG